MELYGYCWLKPLFDWNQLRFRPQFADQVLFGSNVLHGQYIRRRAELQAFFDSIQRVEMAMGWLGQYEQFTNIRDRLISWMVHVCLLQFRLDILHWVKRDIREDQRAEALKGERPFSMQYFREVLIDKMYLISGNRCDIKSVSTLAHFLFDFDDGLPRTHWEDLPFRKLYRRVLLELRMRDVEVSSDGSRGLEADFQQRFWRRLLAYHWILPYPAQYAIMQKTKNGERMWYSIVAQKELIEPQLESKEVRGGRCRRERRERDVKYRKQRMHEECLGGLRWIWGRKSWKRGQAAALPVWMTWEKERWEKWMCGNMRDS